LTTVSQPTPNNTGTPEDRRARWLLAILALPFAAGPATVAVVALITGTDPFPWGNIQFAVSAAVVASTLIGIAVLIVRPWSTWFGVPNFSDRRDEREQTIFAKACFTTLVVALLILIVGGAVDPSPVVSLTLGLASTTFYLSLIYFARRT
jgi:small neutral amino acid transporter SnatA (MarC family)